MERKQSHKIAKVLLIISMIIWTLYFLMNMFMYFTDKVIIVGGGTAYNSDYMVGMKIGIIFGYILSPIIYAYATNFKGTRKYTNYIVKEGSIKIGEWFTDILLGASTNKSSQRTNTELTTSQTKSANMKSQHSTQQSSLQTTQQTPPAKIDDYVIDALENGFDITPYRCEMTSGGVTAGEAFDALEELLKKYNGVLGNAIDSYKNAKKWYGYSGTASDGMIEISYYDSGAEIRYEFGRFKVSRSEAHSLGSLKSFAPYIDVIDY
ncbi:hypothetical protein [Macrococcus capreoli]|uniref:hypothetical protein n=1 Tax=Macrococcus capreoli TaxID=2982690 RepID=UPI003EE6C54C